MKNAPSETAQHAQVTGTTTSKGQKSRASRSRVSSAPLHPTAVKLAQYLVVAGDDLLLKETEFISQMNEILRNARMRTYSAERIIKLLDGAGYERVKVDREYHRRSVGLYPKANHIGITRMKSGERLIIFWQAPRQ